MSSIYYIIKEENTKLSEKEAGNKEQIYRHYPEVLQIELTDRCNGECIMCSHFYKQNRNASDLADGVLESLEPYLKYTKLVLLNGYGEPFVSSKYRRCMNLLKKYEAKAFVTTNLSVFNDDIADDAENIFSQISVSCHGVDKETYEKISRGLSFDRFVNNLEKLISLKNPPAIAISTVAMAANIKYAEDMVRFAHRHHIGEVRFGRLGINSYIGNSDQDLSNYPFVAAHYFRKALKAADSYGIRLIIPENYLSEKYDDSIMLKQQLEIFDKIEFRYSDVFQKQLQQEYHVEAENNKYIKQKLKPYDIDIKCSGICDWVCKGMYIDKNGNAFSCCESEEAFYGNILSDGMEEILNGTSAQKTRKMFYDGNLPYFCINCPFIANQELKMLSIEKKDSLYRAPDYSFVGESTYEE